MDLNEFKSMSEKEIEIWFDMKKIETANRDGIFLFVAGMSGIVAVFIIAMTLIIGCDPPRNNNQSQGESVIENISNAVGK